MYTVCLGSKFNISSLIAFVNMIIKLKVKKIFAGHFPILSHTEILHFRKMCSLAKFSSCVRT